MKRNDDAVVITDAAQSREEEWAARRRRYGLMMSTRILLLIGAVLIVKVSVVAAIALAVVGTVMPWLAVVMANDGPPRAATQRRTNHVTPPVQHDRVLEATPAPVRSHEVIDGDVIAQTVETDTTGTSEQGRRGAA